MKGTFVMPEQAPDRASLDQLMESIEADDAERARLLLDRDPDADEQADSAEPGSPARHRRAVGQALPLSRASSS